MTILRYAPWAPGNRFQAEINNAFGHFCGNADTDVSGVATSQWTPRVDIREEGKRFVIRADIPGVEPNDIEVSMDKGVLSIKGERKSETGEDSGKQTRVERFHGAFQRRFALPDSADADGISASGRHGVLEISIPKKAETTPRKIAVTH